MNSVTTPARTSGKKENDSGSVKDRSVRSASSSAHSPQLHERKDSRSSSPRKNSISATSQKKSIWEKVCNVGKESRKFKGSASTKSGTDSIRYSEQLSRNSRTNTVSSESIASLAVNSSTHTEASPHEESTTPNPGNGFVSPEIITPQPAVSTRQLAFSSEASFEPVIAAPQLPSTQIDNLGQAHNAFFDDLMDNVQSSSVANRSKSPRRKSSCISSLQSQTDTRLYMERVSAGTIQAQWVRSGYASRLTRAVSAAPVIAENAHLSQAVPNSPQLDIVPSPEHPDISLPRISSTASLQIPATIQESQNCETGVVTKLRDRRILPRLAPISIPNPSVTQENSPRSTPRRSRSRPICRRTSYERLFSAKASIAESPITEVFNLTSSTVSEPLFEDGSQSAAPFQFAQPYELSTPQGLPSESDRASSPNLTPTSKPLGTSKLESGRVSKQGQSSGPLASPASVLSDTFDDRRAYLRRRESRSHSRSTTPQQDLPKNPSPQQRPSARRAASAHDTLPSINTTPGYEDITALNPFGIIVPAVSRVPNLRHARSSLEVELAVNTRGNAPLSIIPRIEYDHSQSIDLQNRITVLSARAQKLVAGLHTNNDRGTVDDSDVLQTLLTQDSPTSLEPKSPTCSTPQLKEDAQLSAKASSSSDRDPVQNPNEQFVTQAQAARYRSPPAPLHHIGRRSDRQLPVSSQGVSTIPPSKSRIPSAPKGIRAQTHLTPRSSGKASGAGEDMYPREAAVEIAKILAEGPQDDTRQLRRSQDDVAPLVSQLNNDGSSQDQSRTLRKKRSLTDLIKTKFTKSQNAVSDAEETQDEKGNGRGRSQSVNSKRGHSGSNVQSNPEQDDQIGQNIKSMARVKIDADFQSFKQTLPPGHEDEKSKLSIATIPKKGFRFFNKDGTGIGTEIQLASPETQLSPAISITQDKLIPDATPEPHFVHKCWECDAVAGKSKKAKNFAKCDECNRSVWCGEKCKIVHKARCAYFRAAVADLEKGAEYLLMAPGVAHPPSYFPNLLQKWKNMCETYIEEMDQGTGLLSYETCAILGWNIREFRSKKRSDKEWARFWGHLLRKVFKIPLLEANPDDLQTQHPNHHLHRKNIMLMCWDCKGPCSGCGRKCCVWSALVSEFKTLPMNSEEFRAVSELKEDLRAWIELRKEPSTSVLCVECNKEDQAAGKQIQRFYCPCCFEMCPMEKPVSANRETKECRKTLCVKHFKELRGTCAGHQHHGRRVQVRKQDPWATVHPAYRPGGYFDKNGEVRNIGQVALPTDEPSIKG